MTTTPAPFKYFGNAQSSQQPYINVGQVRLARNDVHTAIVNERLANVSPTENPVYIATGGGYGANDHLIEMLKKNGDINKNIPSIKGADFRNHPFITEENETVRQSIRQFLNPEAPETVDPKAVEQILSSYFSDECNTKIAKEVVKGFFKKGASVIHESASIYPDTIERVNLAREKGLKTVLIAGTRDVEKAIEEKSESIEKFNTAKSYQAFAARFESELVGRFDEIKLYNTDGPEPILIAEKTGPDQSLQIIDQELYAAFKKQAEINPLDYGQPKSAVGAEHAQVAAGKAQYGVGSTTTPLSPGAARQ
jgi:hypothetical protein